LMRVGARNRFMSPPRSHRVAGAGVPRLNARTWRSMLPTSGIVDGSAGV
jgi:hypothetical protein